MSRLSIGRLIAIATVVTIVLLFSIDTAFACRYLWRSHYYGCAPVYYYCPPAPCRVVITPSCTSTAPAPAPAPAAVQESTELPEPPPVKQIPADDASAIQSPSDDTGFTEPQPEVSDPTDSLVDEPEIVDDLPDVDTPDDADVFDLPDDTTTDLPDDTTTDLPDDTTTDLPDDTTTDLPSDNVDDPLGDLFNETTDDLPDATDTPADTNDDPLGDLFDDSTTDLPDATDTPANDADDPLGDIFDEPTDDGTGADADLPADGGNDSLDDIFDELPPDDAPADNSSGNDDELMNDLFGGSEPADNTAEPRVANNPDEEQGDDELFRELEEATDLDSDLPTDDLDAGDLFPMDGDDATDTSSEPVENELDDLFSGLPEKETLGFHEVPPRKPAAAPVVENKPRETAVTPREGVTRKVEQFKPAMRVWTDNTGMYRTVGRLVKIGETHVRLLKDNGRFSTVAKRRLSRADLAYVQEMVKYLGIEELDYVARR